MNMRNNKIYPLLILFSISFITFKVTSSKQIVVVVAIDDDNTIARNIIFNALNEHPSIKDSINIKEIFLLGNETENRVCEQIFEVGLTPTFMIDVTKKNQINGSNDSSIIMNLSRKMGLPTISTDNAFGQGFNNWKDLDHFERKILISVNQVGHFIPYIIKDLCIHFQLKAVAIFYDESFQFDEKLLVNIDMKHIVRPLDKHLLNFTKIMEDVNKFNVNNYFILATIKTLNRVVEIFNKLEMFKSDSTFYMISKEEGKLKCANCTNAIINLVQPIPSPLYDYDHTAMKINFTNDNKIDSMFIYDLSHFAIEIVHELMNESLWPNTIKFPKCGHGLSDEQKRKRSLIDLPRQFSMRGIFGMYGRFVFDPYESAYQEITMRVTKVAMNFGSQNKLMEIAEWDFEGQSGNLLFTNSLIDGRPPLKTVPHYNIVTVVQPPFVMMKADNETQGNDRFYGFCIDLFKEILNSTESTFEYTIRLVEDGNFGTKELKNNTWNGMIGELARKEADIALGPLSIMLERETVVDFTIPYYDLVGIQIIMKKPFIESHLFKFLTVLEATVWFCILGAYIFTSILMSFMDRLSPYSFLNDSESYDDERNNKNFTLKESLWFCMASLTPQGGGEAPRYTSGRFVAATWWLFGFIVIASYTANLAAFLTVSRLDSPIESLEHLSKQYKIRYAAQKGTATSAFFERMAGIEEKFYQIWKEMSLNDDLEESERAKLAVWDYPISNKYTKIWAQMQDAGQPESLLAGITRVLETKSADSGFAFLTEATLVKYAVKTHCDLQSVGEEFSRKPLAFAVQKNSPLKGILDEGILNLLNQQRIEELKDYWWNKNSEFKDCTILKKQTDSISIENIGGVFLLILVGVGLACIALAIEYWYFKGKRDTQIVAVSNFNNGMAPMRPHQIHQRLHTMKRFPWSRY